MPVKSDPSPVVQTTAFQVRSGYDPISWAALSPRLVQMDEDTLRVCVRVGRRRQNTDIRYDRGPDTYTVKRHTSRNGIDWESSEPVSDCYCDMLSEMIVSSLSS